jgi:hypothetical protein
MQETEYPPATAFRTVVLDVAPAYRSVREQEAVSDLILHLLERGYQIFLCCTTAREQFDAESFAQPGLRLLREPMPPGEGLLRREAALTAPGTLWITDDDALQQWIREAGLAFAFPGQRAVSFAPDAAVGTLQELAAVLDPTADALRAVVAAVASARARKPGGALLVGVGGAPASGFERFAVALKRELETTGFPLAELVDLAPFLTTAGEPGAAAGGLPWRDAGGGKWLLDAILKPLVAGQRIYLERRPPQAPRDFEAHFPLFIAEDAVVVLLGEMPFVPPLRDCFDVTVLLELSPEEAARRLFEIPEGEKGDPTFTEQYLAAEGRVYGNYLAAHHVVEGASVRIDANRPRAFFLRPPLRLAS